MAALMRAEAERKRLDLGLTRGMQGGATPRGAANAVMTLGMGRVDALDMLEFMAVDRGQRREVGPEFRAGWEATEVAVYATGRALREPERRDLVTVQALLRALRSLRKFLIGPFAATRPEPLLGPPMDRPEQAFFRADVLRWWKRARRPSIEIEPADLDVELEAWLHCLELDQANLFHWESLDGALDVLAGRKDDAGVVALVLGNWPRMREPRIYDEYNVLRDLARYLVERGSRLGLPDPILAGVDGCLARWITVLDPEARPPWESALAGLRALR